MSFTGKKFVFRIIAFLDFFHRLIKAKAKRLKLLRFEIWFWFRLQVKNKVGGGLRANKPNELGPFEWDSLKHWIISLKGTQLIRFITLQPSQPYFLPEDEIRTRFRHVVILIF
jgi:hypothetical protein